MLRSRCQNRVALLAMATSLGTIFQGGKICSPMMIAPLNIVFANLLPKILPQELKQLYFRARL
jgi:hypothetical protein